MQRSQRRQQCALSYRRVQTAPTSTYGLRVVGFRTTFRVVGGAVELRSWVTKFGYEVWLRSERVSDVKSRVSNVWRC